MSDSISSLTQKIAGTIDRQIKVRKERREKNPLPIESKIPAFELELSQKEKKKKEESSKS